MLHLSLDWTGASEPWPASCHLLHPVAQAACQHPSHSHVYDSRPVWLAACTSPDAAVKSGQISVQAEETLKPPTCCIQA